MNAVLEKARELSVTLAMTPEIQARLREGEGALSSVKGYEITDHDTANAVAEEMNGYKRAIVKLEDLRKGFLRPAQEIIENAKSLFNPAIEGFKGAEAHCKLLLAGWSDKEQKRIAMANALREEAARKVRQEAEREAAAARARAEEAAAEARRKAQEAETARQKALAEGNARAAAAAAAEKAKQDERARSAVENGEAKAQEAHLTAAAQVAAVPVAEQQKVAGTQMRDNWIGQLAPNTTEEQAKAMIVEAVGKGRTDLLGVLDLNTGAVDKLAKALKTSMNVPGFIAFNNRLVAGSKR